MKWNKDNIDTFFRINKKHLLRSNQLISPKEIQILGKEFHNWYQAINRSSNNAYINMSTFKVINNIKFSDNNRVWTRSKIVTFYNKNKSKLVSNGGLISPKIIYKLGNTYWNWYQAITRKSNNVYKNINEFKKEQGLKDNTFESNYTKEKIDEFYLENKDRLLKNGYLKLPKSLKKGVGIIKDNIFIHMITKTD